MHGEAVRRASGFVLVAQRLLIDRASVASGGIRATRKLKHGALYRQLPAE